MRFPEPIGCVARLCASLALMTNQPPSAKDVMGRDPVTVAADTPLLDVLHLMVVAQIGGVAVVGDRGAVVGVITAADLLRAVDQVSDDDLDELPTGAGEESLSALRAADILSPEPIWVAPDTPAATIARLMRARGVHRVLVGVDGHLEGIVTTFDLIGLLDMTIAPAP
ncbi:MAG: CBS domain-containing protein [Myxococcales bacterium]|nr:CBS domain-containing protein [Myxococcales bacterium]